ncbi:ribonuclease E/G [Gluconacetobacter tumulisoli]|uniref:Ribonuclease n=1 Tax=Gluconacetobacter tumulisoli TaxID=1286189 RepID=A0A7W4K9Q0_9PROT|nr:ribonuclease [Gluconacetobacter tumulisoli]
MTIRIRAASAPGEIRIAVTDDARTDEDGAAGAGLIEYALWRPGAPDGIGDLHRGRIVARMPAMGGAFVDLTDGASGFLPDSAGAAGLTEGDAVLVRIMRSAQGGKGARLAACPPDAVPESDRTGPPALLARGPTPLEALAAAWPDASILIDDASVGARIPSALRNRMLRTTNAFDAETEAASDALDDPTVDLPGGMRATITPTPALVAIDMDGGAASADRRAKQTAQFAANRDALPALLHQIRLRNLSGAIILDVAGLAIRKRQALRPIFEESLACDPLRPRFLGFTALGLAEILRSRVRPPLHELVSGAHGQALRALRHWVRATRGTPGPAATLRVGTDIARALDRDPDAVADATRLAGHLPARQLDPSLPPLGWTLSGPENRP